MRMRKHHKAHAKHETTNKGIINTLAIKSIKKPNKIIEKGF